MSFSTTLRFIWRHPANRKRRLRAIGRAVGWQVYKRVTGQPRDIEVWSGLRLRCHPKGTSASAVLYANGWPDYHEMHFMQHFLRQGDGFIDVGANVGVYSLLAASLVGPHGKVLAFEPAPESFDRFIENVQLNRLQNISARRAAVHSRSGTVRMRIGQDTVNRLLDAASSEDLGRSLAADEIEVPSVRLDDVVDGPYMMGKIDIEGAELMALRGAGGLLSRANPPVWLLEISNLTSDFDYTPEELEGWLRERGYDLAVYDADARTLRTEDGPWRKRANVLAISASARELIDARLTATRA